MAARTNESLSSLLSRSSLDDHAQILAASETALKSSPTDVQAQHAKAVALLKLDRYQDAVAFFDAAGSELKDKAATEYAYALYKAGNLELAAKTAAELSGNRGAQHVEAQARYRLEQYERTAQLYKELQNESSVTSEGFDLRVNQAAIDAQGQWLGLLDAAAARRPDRDDLAAFETAYNAACGSIARGELSQAEVLLKRARTLCQHSEELTDEQKKEELGPIMVQQAYVLYRGGKISEAEAVAAEIDVGDLADLATKRVASNNKLLMHDGSTNPFVVHRSFNSAPKIPESDKLFSYQSIPLLSNEKTINLNSFKSEGLSKSTPSVTRKTKETARSATTTIADTNRPQEPPSLEALLTSSFHAAALAKNEINRAAVNRVLAGLQHRPADLGFILTLAQMFTLIGDTTSAIDLVKTYAKGLEDSHTDVDLEARYNPSLISVLTALYRLQGRRGQIKRELAQAASYWKQKPCAPTTLLRAAGISLLASPSSSTTQASHPPTSASAATPSSEVEDDTHVASEIFDKLYREQPDDKATIAGYVASHALQDLDSVKSLVVKLKPVSELTRSVDVNALESVGIPQASNALAIAQKAAGGGGTAAAAAASMTNRNGASRKRPAPGAGPTGADDGASQRKRIRKSRLPKGYDPTSEAKPDPERWLPVRDRSYYRPPKGKKKGKKGDDRTQGGAVSEDLDVSKQQTSMTAAKGGEIVTGGSGKTKKKGKGKK